MSRFDNCSSHPSASIESTLHDRITDLVTLAHKGAANDGPDIVGALVDAARWNPAMLEAAIGTAHERPDAGDEHLDAAVANLRDAARVVRKRVY